MELGLCIVRYIFKLHEYEVIVAIYAFQPALSELGSKSCVQQLLTIF